MFQLESYQKVSSNVAGPRGGSRELQGFLKGIHCPADDEHKESVSVTVVFMAPMTGFILSDSADERSIIG